MKATELQINDWVFVAEYDEYTPTPHNKPYPVQILHGADIDRADEVRFEPIPITPEILEKNGWEKAVGENPVEVWTIKKGVYLHNTDNGYKLREGAEFNVPNIKYVHQLQRALRCCGLWDLVDNFKID